MFLKTILITKKYPDKVIHGIGNIGHVLYNSNSYFRTILDNELLSACNEIIFTGGSTYGFLAVMKNKKMAYHVDGKTNMKKCKKMDLHDSPVRSKDITLFK